MKTFKTTLLTIAALLCSISVNAYFEVDGIRYNVTSQLDLEVEVTSKEMSYSGVVEIPENVTYNGNMYSVKSIGRKAFFSCRSLTGIIIPNTVTTIGGSAFSQCSKLTNVYIPNSVTSIGSSAFEFTNLTSVTIPNSVTSIESYTFYSCINLSDVNIPNSVVKIGSSAFKACI